MNARTSGSARSAFPLRHLSADEDAHGGFRLSNARAVAALDNPRLDLLRLRAGVGAVSDLTPSIEAARAASESISVELAARREVNSIAQT